MVSVTGIMGGDEQSSSIGLIAFGAVGCRGKLYQWMAMCSLPVNLQCHSPEKQNSSEKLFKAARSVHEALFRPLSVALGWIKQSEFPAPAGTISACGWGSTLEFLGGPMCVRVVSYSPTVQANAPAAPPWPGSRLSIGHSIRPIQPWGPRDAG